MASSSSPSRPPGAMSVTADGAANNLVTAFPFTVAPPVSLPGWFQNGNHEQPHHDYDYQETPIDTIVSDHVVLIVNIAVVVVLCGIISACGLVANVVNVLVFFRQGALSSSSNVSLLALAFSDIGCLLPVFCNSINLALFYLGLSTVFLTPRDFMDTMILWPHIMFMQISSWITAYVAFERCLCVLFPLKVRSLFSARKSLLVSTSIALVVVALFLPTFVTQRIATMRDPFTNATGIVYAPTPLHVQILDISDVIHAIILRPLALLVVFVCTQITVYRVKLSAAWRKTITTVASSSNSTVPLSTIASPATTTMEETSSKKNRDLLSNRDDTLHNSTITSRGSDVIMTIHDPSTDGSISQDSGMNSSETQTLKQSSPRPPLQPPPPSSTVSTTAAAAAAAASAGTSSSPSATSSKESRLVQTILTISIIFLVCNAPDIVGVFVLISLQTRLQLSLGDNLFNLFIAAQLCLQALCSAINIGVYYRLSTSYRHAFRKLMRMR